VERAGGVQAHPVRGEPRPGGKSASREGRVEETVGREPGNREASAISGDPNLSADGDLDVRQGGVGDRYPLESVEWAEARVQTAVQGVEARDQDRIRGGPEGNGDELEE
jgi:hypothetical protein